MAGFENGRSVFTGIKDVGVKSVGRHKFAENSQSSSSCQFSFSVNVDA